MQRQVDRTIQRFLLASFLASLIQTDALQEGAPVDHVQDEEGERKEESGHLVDVNRSRSALAAGVVLNGRGPDRASVPLRIVPHRCLSGESNNWR